TFLLDYGGLDSIEHLHYLPDIVTQTKTKKVSTSQLNDVQQRSESQILNSEEKTCYLGVVTEFMLHMTYGLVENDEKKHCVKT
uniref:Uncharacterized protein n=1 Tax=Romanomermis culicivorax TaxID=13658 RepID=A0A915HIK7_ROMCU